MKVHPNLPVRDRAPYLQETMATTAVTQTKIECTECILCHEHFKQPKILPCAHILCRNCLVQCLQPSSGAKCPLCKYEIVEVTKLKDKQYDVIADSFPTDLAMEGLVEGANLLSKRHVLCICDDVIAVSLCLHCGDMFCRSCVKAHAKMSETRNHVTRDLDTLTPEMIATGRQAHCPVHPEESSKLFCSLHCVPICHLCATSEHGTCGKFTELMTNVEAARQSLSDTEAHLRKTESSIEGSMKRIDEELLKAEKGVKEAVTKIDLAFDRLSLSVETRRQEMKNDVLQHLGEKTKFPLQEAKDRLLTKRGRVTSHRLLVQRVRETVSSEAIFPMKSVIKLRISDIDHDTAKSFDEDLVTKYDLKIDSKVMDRLVNDVATLGSVVCELPKVTPKPETKDTQNVWRFHSNHGKNSVLSEDGKIASRMDKSGNGILLSNEPMDVNMLYEVRVDEVGGDLGVIGITCEEPEKLTPLPKITAKLPRSILIGDNHVLVSGEMVEYKNGLRLKNIDNGSCIGVLVDSSKHVHLYIDKHDQGVAGLVKAKKCWAVFDVGYKFKKITALPKTTVESRNKTPEKAEQPEKQK